MDVGPLYGLRLRTTRLELRLPTHEELAELRGIARAGVHPPEFMPFYVPWTDLDDGSDGFVVSHYEEVLAAWRPDSWSLDLCVWADGALAGVQDLRGRDFAATRTVDTGSWLGMRYQRRGFGTEMRAAVLELAFMWLGAERATSGSFDGNDASIRVSEKLGYRAAGRSQHAPRGVPQWHTDFELRREDWRPPIAVEIEGLDAALPLFGVAVTGGEPREGRRG